MILLIGIIVFFIALIVFIVLSAKKTHWMNLVGAFFVFCFAVFYFLMIGVVLKTNRAWKEVLQKNEQRLEKQQQDLKIALTGESDELEFTPDSLQGAETEAQKLVYGRGRVWRAAMPQAFTPGADPNDLTAGSIVVNLPPDSPAFQAKVDPAAGAPAAAGDDSTSLVYVFLEVPDPDGGYQISNYIGIFSATDPAPNNASVKLSPSLILPDPENVVELKAVDPNYKTARELVTSVDNTTRWAMYDILPTDSYDVFRDAIRAETGRDSDEEVPLDELRTALTTKYMTKEALRLQGSPEKYERIIDEIVYTNQPIDVYQQDAEFTPADDETWYEVEFKEKAKGSFKVDFESSVGEAQRQIALQGQAFDREGLAQVETLKLGEKDGVVFEKDQTVLLDHEAWETSPEDFLAKMKEAKTVVEKEVIFRRKLNDFDFEFRDLVEQNKQLTADRDHAQAKLDQGLKIEEDYENQADVRLATRDRIDQDLTNFRRDETAIKAYRQTLEAKLKDERKEIDRLFRICKESLAKKALLEAKFKQIIQEKTRQAEAAAGDAQ